MHGRIDAGGGGHGPDLLLSPFAEAALFDYDGNVAARNGLQREGIIASFCSIISWETFLPPRKVGPGVCSLKANHNRRARGTFWSDDVHRNVDTGTGSKVHATADHAVCEWKNSIG